MRCCWRCGAGVESERVGVRDVCDGCRSYLHCCRNCELYEPGAHNDCREPDAEMVADKEQANFCDFFHFAAGGRGAVSSNEADDARAKLERLFRK